MWSILAFAAAGLALAAAMRYVIERWLGSDPEEEWLDRGEARMQNYLRWFSAFVPVSRGRVRWRRGLDGRPERVPEDRQRP